MPSSPPSSGRSLATLASRVPDGDDWLHELKFDGYRALAFFENGKVRLVSRNGNDWTARFRAVADALGNAARSRTPFSTAKSCRSTQTACRTFSSCKTS